MYGAPGVDEAGLAEWRKFGLSEVALKSPIKIVGTSSGGKEARIASTWSRRSVIESSGLVSVPQCRWVQATRIDPACGWTTVAVRRPRRSDECRAGSGSLLHPASGKALRMALP